MSNNGEMAVLLLTTNLPGTPYNGGNIPLLIYMKDPQTREYVWGAASLKDLAILQDVRMGVVIDGFERLNDIDPQLFDQNFNVVTMTWSSVDIPFDQMDNGQQYRLSEIANRDLEEIMWFHLGEIPFQDQTFQTKEEAVAFAESEIDKIVLKYSGDISIANIFKEVNPDNIVYQLWKRFGDDFIIEVYEHVRQVLPDGKIIVNNSFNYSKTIEGSTYLYTLEYANILKSHDLIDAVGMEMHQAQSSWSVDHPLVIEDAVEVMRSFGLPVYVTELDVNKTYLPGADQEKIIEQAQLYEDVVRTCIRSQVCEIINFWASTDQSSRYEFAVGEPNANAGIFEDDGTPKLAYYAVLRGLTEGYVPPIP